MKSCYYCCLGVSLALINWGLEGNLTADGFFDVAEATQASMLHLVISVGGCHVTQCASANNCCFCKSHGKTALLRGW